MYSKDYRPADSSSNSSSSGETEPLLPTPPQEESSAKVTPTNAHKSNHLGFALLFVLLALLIQHHRYLRVANALHEYEYGGLCEYKGEKSLRSELAESVRLRAVDVAQTQESLGKEISRLRKQLAEVYRHNSQIQELLDTSHADLKRRLELDVIEVVKRLETGANWHVFSYGTPLSFGYASKTPLHPSVPINSIKVSFSSYRPTQINRERLVPDNLIPRKHSSTPQIVGYRVRSTMAIGLFGRWQSLGLKEFGGSDITFAAGSWGYSGYEAEIFFIAPEA